MSKGFTHEDVPDQTGKTAFITGANTGIGFHTARVLAGKGARVLLGCRTRSKAEDARAQILAEHPGADVRIIDIDLADLDSIRAAAEAVQEEERLDLLINNAGLMIPPYQKTEQGFESQFGVNHLGTFALTGLLLDKLEQTPGSRIVNTSSNAHKMGKVDFDALNAEKGYSAMKQYALSKIANLLHAHELDRRLKARDSDTIAVTAHPGASDTELSRHIPALPRKIFLPLLRPLFNTAAQGAWPTLMGATAPHVQGGEYFGPRGLGELAGPAERVKANALSKNEQVAQKLWDVSVELTGVDPQLSPA